jgi:hypothetical protein
MLIDDVTPPAADEHSPYFETYIGKVRSLPFRKTL